MWRSKLGGSFPREEIERLDAKHHAIIKQLRSEPGNNRCAECQAPDTMWASVNLGIFVCVRCADVHRALGTHISKMKGCGGTYLWGPDEIARMQTVGNVVAHKHYSSLSGGPSYAAGSWGKDELLQFCRQKYENRPTPTSSNCVIVEKDQQMKQRDVEMAGKKLPAMSRERDIPDVCARDRPSNVAHASPLKSRHAASVKVGPLADSFDLDFFLEECLKPAPQSLNKLLDAPTAEPARCHMVNSLSAESHSPGLRGPEKSRAVAKFVEDFDFDDWFGPAR